MATHDNASDNASDDDLFGRVIELAELVAYQNAAVVSRTLMKRPTGTVTLFAFDAAEGLSEHTAPFDAMVQVLEGELEITIAGDPFRVGAGQMIVMPGGKPHALRAIRPTKMMLVMIRS